jgi:RNA polymerase sigma-70 factor, ECF subfamily
VIAEPAPVAPRARANRETAGGPGSRLGARVIRLQDRVVARAKAGDQEAIGQLYEQHAVRVYQYFLKRVDGRAQQAEDLTSEVFVRALEGLEGYQSRGLPFSAWLFRIARNLLVDHIRSQPRDPLLTLETCLDLPTPLAERALDQVADRCDLVRAFRRLTREQREVLTLRFIQGWSIAETSARLGKTEEAIKKLQARGLVTLQRTLLGPGATSPDPPPASCR